jgi:hypothetical protein
VSKQYVKICTNGHVLIDSDPLSRDTFCEKCGSKMLINCPNCRTSIYTFNFDGIIFLGTPNYDRPSYCKSCGKPYPWTQSALEATALILQEDKELSEQDRKNLGESLPDLISETPKTQLALIRLKKVLPVVGHFTAEALRQFVIDFGCDLAKSLFGI